MLELHADKIIYFIEFTIHDPGSAAVIGELKSERGACWNKFFDFQACA